VNSSHRNISKALLGVGVNPLGDLHGGLFKFCPDFCLVCAWFLSFSNLEEHSDPNCLLSLAIEFHKSRQKFLLQSVPEGWGSPIMPIIKCWIK
jgi:hypothetical protein